MGRDIVALIVRKHMASWWRKQGVWWLLACTICPIIFSLCRAALSDSAILGGSPSLRDLSPIVVATVLITAWLFSAARTKQAIEEHEGIQLRDTFFFSRFKVGILSGLPFLIASWVGESLGTLLGDDLQQGFATWSLAHLLGVGAFALREPLSAVCLVAWLIAVLVLTGDARWAWILFTGQLVGQLLLLRIDRYIFGVLERNYATRMIRDRMWPDNYFWLISFVFLAAMLYCVWIQRNRVRAVAGVIAIWIAAPVFVEAVLAIALAAGFPPWLTGGHLPLWWAATTPLVDPTHLPFWLGDKFPAHQFTAMDVGFLLAIVPGSVCYFTTAVLIAGWLRWVDARGVAAPLPSSALLESA